MTIEQDIADYLEKVRDTINRFDKSTMNKLVELLLETYHKGGTIYTLGNGGSAATASHICGDLIKGCSQGLEKRFKSVCLTDNIASLLAIANDDSYDDVFIEQLKNFLEKDDLVIGISGSGNSINVVKAIEYANSMGIKTVAFCGYNGGKIKEIAALTLHAEIDDMEITEDIHSIIGHCIKQMLIKELKNEKMGEKYRKRIEGQEVK